MGKLRIFRPNAYFSVFRGLAIRINDKKVGYVKNNSTFEIDLEAGHYEIRVHMDWCKSPVFEVDLHEDQLISLEAQLNGGYFGAMFNSFFNWNKLYTLIPLTQKSKCKNND